MPVVLAPFSLDRMVRAVEQVRERLLRATAALERAAIPYAVIGGNAVAVWVARVDEAAVRNTRDVDVLLRREDLDAARAALASDGFVYRHVRGVDAFLDGPNAKIRDAVHVLFAGEVVGANGATRNPDVVESVDAGAFRVLSLEALVRLKLQVYRLKDQVHIQDMLDVGLIDESWCDRLPSDLAGRLRTLIDNLER